MTHAIDALQSCSLPVSNPDLLEGIPPHLLKTIEKKNSSGKKEWHLTLSLPVMAYANNRELRTILYLAKMQLASKGDLSNEANLSSQLAIRKELAQLLGYPSFAAYSLDGKMAKTAKRVRKFLETLKERAQQKGKCE